MTVYIFRHGMAVHPHEGYGNRVLTAELLPEGIPPIRRLAHYLQEVPADYRACSEVLRCRQTAGIVTEITGHPFEIDPRLREYHNERFEELAERTKSFAESLQQRRAANTLVCTHGAVIAALKHYLLEGVFDRSHETDYVQTGQMLVIHDDNTCEVLDFNSEKVV